MVVRCGKNVGLQRHGRKKKHQRRLPLSLSQRRRLRKLEQRGSKPPLPPPPKSQLKGLPEENGDMLGFANAMPPLVSLLPSIDELGGRGYRLVQTVQPVSLSTRLQAHLW